MTNAKVQKCREEIRVFSNEISSNCSRVNQLKDVITETALREDYQALPALVEEVKALRERRAWLKAACANRRAIIAEKGQN